MYSKKKKIDTGLKISLELDENNKKVQLFKLSFLMSEYPDMDFTKEHVKEMTDILKQYIENTK